MAPLPDNSGPRDFINDYKSLPNIDSKLHNASLIQAGHRLESEESFAIVMM